MDVYATQALSNAVNTIKQEINKNISVDDMLDDMLSDLSTKPNIPDTPEDKFFNYFTGDKFGKIVILSHWLKYHYSIYDRMAQYNLCVATTLNKEGLKRAPFIRYVRILIEEYLMNNHAGWFVKGAGGVYMPEPADMGKVIDRLLDVPRIKADLFSKNRT